MKTLAWCGLGWERAVRKAAGIQPITTPPLTTTTFTSNLLSGYDFIYIKLHGLANQSYWYGSNWETAVSAKQLQQCNLSGTIIFVSNCYLPNSPMLNALLQAGAQAVIGGEGLNYAGINQLSGADKLGYYFRRLLILKRPPNETLTIAKKLLYKRNNSITKDTKQFQVWTNKDKKVIT